MHNPFVFFFTWGGENCHVFCQMLSLDTAGKMMPSVEDVSHLLKNLKVSPGGGHFSDGSVSICVGKSDV